MSGEQYEVSKNAFLLTGFPKMVVSLSIYIIVGVLLFWGLSDLHDFAFGLYHTIAELFSIIIAWAIFIIGWNVQKINRNRFFLFIGASLALIGCIDLLHALSFSGVTMIPGYETNGNLPTALWVVARYAESTAFLFTPFIGLRENKRGFKVIIILFFTIVISMVIAVFAGWFPTCFINGVGLTLFKKVSEYVIISIFGVAAVVFYHFRRNFDANVLRLLIAAIAVSMVSEFLFTLYSTPQDYIQVGGHFLKIVAFYLIYRALIVKSLQQPVETLFRAVKEQELQYQSLFNSMTEGFALHQIICDASGLPINYRFLIVNEPFERLTGLKKESVIGKTALDVLPGLEPFWIETYGKVALTGEPAHITNYIQPLKKYYDVIAYRPAEGKFATVFMDVTAREEADARLQHKDELLHAINAVLLEGLTSKTEWALAIKCLEVAQTLTRSKFGFIGELNKAGKLDDIAISDTGWAECRMNESDALKLIKHMNIRGIWSTVLTDECSHIINNPAGHAASTGVPPGHPAITRLLGIPLKIGGKTAGLIALANKDVDFTDQDQSDIEQLAVAFSEALLRRRIEENAQMLAKFPEENPCPILRVSSDYTLLYANPISLKILQAWGCAIGGKLPQLWSEPQAEDLKLEKSISIESSVDNRIFAFAIVPIQGKGYINLYGMEISEQKQAEYALQQRTQELERSNRELESFAYAASHDLQEPLRMVTSFVQLLAQRYKGKLDEDADKYIGILSEGTGRMSRMISDLLEYSRIQTKGVPFDRVDLNIVFHDTLANLEVTLKEASATITSDNLPVVEGDAIQLGQVFQNLIGNAIKYRKDTEPPVIHVGTMPQKDHEWHLFVRDNGIGIDPKFFDKLFVIFHRLHPRGKYPGTGVGLAVCKKIIERHKGRIWIESEPNKGTTFHFTIRD